MQESDIRRYYDLHGKELENFLTRKLSCSQTAADLTQDVFLKLVSARPEEPLQNPRAYLYRIASNLLVDHFRKTGSRDTVSEEAVLESLPDEEPDPERTILAQNSMEQLRNVIRQLPPRQREILILHKFEELTYAEIADRLGLSKNTVMVHMMRALSTCRTYLGEENSKDG